MKKLMIVLLAVMFLFSAYVYAQNCGACPAKKTCGKLKKVKKESIKVFVLKGDKTEKKLFHKKGCLKKDVIAVSLTDAKKKGYAPCPKCFPKKQEKIVQAKK